MNALLPIGRPVRVEMLLDLVCPWCFLGFRRLQRALAARPQLDVTVAWRPFLLNPDLPESGLPHEEFVRRKYGGDERARRFYRSVSELGEQDGATFRFDRIRRIPSTVDAHRLLGWSAAWPSRTAPFVDGLFTAHFTDGADIGDHGTLAVLAARAGLDADAARDMLRGTDGLDRVHTENLRAHRAGITGVPCVIVGGELAVMGAQESIVLQRLLDAATAETMEIALSR
ncbi:DsbA family oxidoreductase [Rhizosaccharibacter radicis]|uniref:DsbA family oxidoreductase n=1 Tax=Rhizosaccharibacter radicis TaxID=2782605 RepID=A0ABT1VWV6_9PROT|nr:DsbA family oxidoreductase [Acetobacteraceae bacterium KSS12]